MCHPERHPGGETARRKASSSEVPVQQVKCGSSLRESFAAGGSHLQQPCDSVPSPCSLTKTDPTTTASPPPPPPSRAASFSQLSSDRLSRASSGASSKSSPPLRRSSSRTLSKGGKPHLKLENVVVVGQVAVEGARVAMKECQVRVRFRVLFCIGIYSCIEGISRPSAFLTLDIPPVPTAPPIFAQVIFKPLDEDHAPASCWESSWVAAAAEDIPAEFDDDSHESVPGGGPSAGEIPFRNDWGGYPGRCSGGPGQGWD